MIDIEQGSLSYFIARAGESQWQPFLRALADELNAQMPVAELRAFFHVLGRRVARAVPTTAGASIVELERNLNAELAKHGWGWVRIRDMTNSLELLHSCAPLRAAFGDGAMAWAGGLLEGLYAEWLKQAGAGEALVLHQLGEAEGLADTLHFRLALPAQFA